jgi:DNA polymerase-3 subunit epsilon
MPHSVLPFAVVDVETTGLRFDRDQILQIAVVLHDWSSHPTSTQATSTQATSTQATSTQPTSVWSTYVRPSQFWSRDLGPQHIHGITRRQLIFAPSTVKAMQKFAQLTSGRIIVAHNADFDTKFLRAAALEHAIDLHWAGVLCTLQLSRKLDPQRQQTHKLSTLCEKYGVALDQAHHAEHDARATAEVLPHLLTAHGIADAESLQPFLRA